MVNGESKNGIKNVLNPLQNQNFVSKALDRLPANQRALLIILLFFMFVLSLMLAMNIDARTKGYIIIGMLIIIGIWVLKGNEQKIN